MRRFVFIQYLLFALAFVVFGVLAFAKIGGQERQLQDKLQRIHAGELQSESLTVLRKYAYASRHTETHYHLVLRGSKEAQVNERYALIEGRFVAKKKGHMGLWSGSIEEVTRMEPWEIRKAKK